MSTLSKREITVFAVLIALVCSAAVTVRRIILQRADTALLAQLDLGEYSQSVELHTPIPLTASDSVFVLDRSLKRTKACTQRIR